MTSPHVGRDERPRGGLFCIYPAPDRPLPPFRFIADGARSRGAGRYFVTRGAATSLRVAIPLGNA